MDLRVAAERIFHIYYRANDRREIFQEHDNYIIFIHKMKRQLSSVAHILAYCIMPNHFHVLLIPKHDLRENLLLDGEVNHFMPTEQLSAATKAWLMGFTKSYNNFYGLSGSRFQPHGKCKRHNGNFQFGIDYLHQNPVKAGLVDSPGEWGYSSYNEHFMAELCLDNICDLALAEALLELNSQVLISKSGFSSDVSFWSRSAAKWLESSSEV